MKMLEIPIPKIGIPLTTKETIIRVLSENPSVTAKELYTLVLKETKKSVSYQALHKTVQQLEKETVIQRIQNKYSIHPQWLQSMENWLRKTKKHSSTETELQKPELRLFHGVIEVGRFLIFEYTHYPNPQNKPSVCVWKRMYSVIGLSKDEVEGVRNTMGKEHYHIISESNTIVDQFLADTFQKIGCKVKLGIPQPEDFDTMVTGNHVCELYFDATHKKIWKAIWEKTQTMDEFDLEKTLKVMHTGYITKAIIYHDPARAQKIREKVLNEFGNR